MEKIRRIVKEHLREIEAGDLVVVEGGGNRLVEAGEHRTLAVLREVVTLVRDRTGTNPLVMGISMRWGLEATVYGRKRRWVNRQCIRKLEEWRCDGLQLWEHMRWDEVWARDGVHFSSIGKVWIAWNITEWAQDG